jgi:hypothetical protein
MNLEGPFRPIVAAVYWWRPNDRKMAQKRSKSEGRVTVTLFHSHGIGRYDYSSLHPDDLNQIEAIAEERDLLLCPTIFLRQAQLGQFVELIHAYSERSRDGELPHIVGFSLEGPILGSEGGVPRGATWRPTAKEWRIISSLGSFGLRYMVVAPDIFDLGENITGGYSFRDLLCDCYDHGLKMALGHFRRDDPLLSASRVEAILGYLHGRYQSSPYLVLTDHLFNDMPRSFIHAYRTTEARSKTNTEMSAFLAAPWDSDSLSERLGPVPAALLRAARNRLLTPAINFDGFHVDLQICRRTVDYLGSDRLIAMTDDTDLNSMAGEHLHQIADNPLRYRSDDAVAAGSSDYRVQIRNMTAIGMTSEDIELMFGSLPEAALRHTPQIRGAISGHLDA